MSLLSFAAETKQELTQLEVQYDYSKYELAALIRMNGGGWDFESSIDFKYPNGKRDDCQTDLCALEEVLSSGK